MKSILMSIQPKYCELIASGQKTIEVRKTAPKETPFKVYIYETKANKEQSYYNAYHEKTVGKVIGEFTLIFITLARADTMKHAYQHNNPEQTCLTDRELFDYATPGKPLYFWHISQLKIYDNPKELGEFKRRCKRECVKTKKKVKCPKIIEIATKGIFECDNLLLVTRPPQSWCYVEEIAE